MFHTICRVVFITILFAIFVKYFGYPSYVKYNARETMIVETNVVFDTKKPPAITILARQVNVKHGWKNVSQRYIPRSGAFKTFCGKSRTYEDAVRCINESTYDLFEMVNKATNGRNKNLSNDNFWTGDMSTFYWGKSFTLNNSYELGSDISQLIRIYLNKNLRYKIFIHDSDFFLLTMNPIKIPHILFSEAEPQELFVYLTATYHKKMDKPKKHCESSESYSFTACIKNSISRRVGCRLEWDMWSSPDIPICNQMKQLLQFEKEYYELDLWEQMKVVEYTGCYPPCAYTEYKLATEPSKTPAGNESRIILTMPTSEALKKTEEYIYPFESFVSEFGGALGLFLGFSFVMIWDIGKILISPLLKSHIK